MGELTAMLPQGPNQHCGAPAPHERHGNAINDSWCDGIPPLQDFVELTIRVPFVETLEEARNGGILVSVDDMAGMGHEGVLAWISEEGLGTFTTDEMDGSNCRAVLRLRACGKDAFYQIVDGIPVIPKAATDD